jgi:flotillin
LRLVAAEWQAAGGEGREVYVLQQLRAFVESAILRVQATEIGELAVVDGGDGDAYGAMVASFPTAVARVMAETGRALGVDIAALIGRAAGKEVR